MSRLRPAPQRFGRGSTSRGIVLDGRAGTLEATVAVLDPGRRFNRGGDDVLGFGFGSLAGVRVVVNAEDSMVLVFVLRWAIALGWHLHKRKAP